MTMYSAAEMARWTGMPVSAVRRFLADIGADRGSFLDLALLHLVEALRRAGCTHPSLWRDLLAMGERKGDRYAALSAELLVNGSQVWLDELGQIVHLRSSQLALAEIIRQVATRLEWEGTKLVRLRLDGFKHLVIDPARGHGRPTVRDTRLDTRLAASIIKAEHGDRRVLERSYGLTPEVVSEVEAFERLRIEIIHLAPRIAGMVSTSP